MSKSFAWLIMGIWGVAAAGPPHASGLALPAPEGSTGAPTLLGPLQSLSVEAKLSGAGVELTEVRKYALTLYAGKTVTATFHSSVLGAATTDAPAISMAGQPVAGAMLGPDDADGVRRRLTLDLRDPTALRGIGQPLFVSDPVAIAVPANGVVEVRVVSRGPLVAEGTMQGLVVPVDWARPTVPNVDVKVTASSAAPMRALYSPFHALDVVRDGVNAARGSYAGHGVCTDLDLTVLFSSGEGLVHVDLLPFRYGDGEREDGTFLALVTPDPTPVISNVLPRDLALVIDTSGSMAGAKMTQAKQAVRGVLTGLRPADSFSLVSFATTVVSFQSAALVKATADNVQAALAFVDALTANGSTNIDDALRTGLGSLPADTGHPRYVVFLTDGQPTVGVTAVDTIVANVNARNEAGARVFSFGIGNDVNTMLLDRLARETAGDVIYVRPDQDVAVAVDAFFQQISDPVLADPQLDLAAFGAADLFPETLPDLFAGRTVTLLGRFANPGRAPLVLSGSRDGQPWSTTYDVALPDYALSTGYVPRIWALRQVARLLARIKEGNSDQALVDEVVRLATRYGVTTAYTTFTADSNGDVGIRYGAVPVTQTGAGAVDASSALRDYGMSGTVPVGGTPTAMPTSPTGTPTIVRYVSDRTLPPRGGYLTDTKLGATVTGGTDATDIVDLTFGSNAYFALARAEARYGAAGLLATSASVRFELLGRSFRVTDPRALPMGATEPPTESPATPAPGWQPTVAGSTGVISTVGTPPTRPDPVNDPLPPAVVADPAGAAAASDPDRGVSCSVAPHDGGPRGLLIALGFVVAAARRRRSAPPPRSHDSSRLP
jgi:MYXO-CTERM domain-containing protein